MRLMNLPPSSEFITDSGTRSGWLRGGPGWPSRSSVCAACGRSTTCTAMPAAATGSIAGGTGAGSAGQLASSAETASAKASGSRSPEAMRVAPPRCNAAS